MTRIRKLLFGLVGVVAAFGALEIGVRVGLGTPNTTLPIFQPSTGLPGYRLAQNASLDANLGGRRVLVQTDGRGWRRVTSAEAVPESSRRQTVHIIGDSQVFGWGLGDDETISSQLQAMLGPGYLVTNLGVPGYGPFTYAGILSSLPLDDWLVVVHSESGDELWDSYSAKSQFRPACGFLQLRAWERILPCFLLRSATSQGLHAWARRLGDTRMPVPLQYHPLDRTAATVLMSRVEALYERQRELRQEKVLLIVVPWDAAMYPDRLRQYYPPLEEVRPAVLFPDDVGSRARFLKEARTRPLFFAGDNHLSADGARLAAEIIHEHLPIGAAASGDG